MKRLACTLVAAGMLAAGCGGEGEEASLANADDLTVCLSASGLESRSEGGFFVSEDVRIDGEGVEIGPAADPDASALVVPAHQVDEAEKFEEILTEAQLVGQNVLVMPPSLEVALGNEPAEGPVPEEIIDKVRDCIPD